MSEGAALRKRMMGYQKRNFHWTDLEMSTSEEPLGSSILEERLRCFGHVQGRDGGYIRYRMLNMELPGRRRRGGTQMSFVDVVKEEMQRKDGTGQKQMMYCGNP